MNVAGQRMLGFRAWVCLATEVQTQNNILVRAFSINHPDATGVAFHTDLTVIGGLVGIWPDLESAYQTLLESGAVVHLYHHPDSFDYAECDSSGPA
jgi:hypothetical protein